MTDQAINNATGSLTADVLHLTLKDLHFIRKAEILLQTYSHASCTCVRLSSILHSETQGFFLMG